jgi:DNA-binding beta-propeller fold protein YncE
MILALSYVTTKFDLLKKHWEEKKKGIVTPKDDKFWVGYGMVALLDWDKKEIIKSINQESPMGILQDGNKLYVNDTRDNEIKIYNIDLDLISVVKNKHFNDLHSIQYTNDNNFLITSTGLDLVLKIDKSGKTINEWWAGEHGFDKDQNNINITFDRTKLYSDESIPTSSQSTHLNYSIELDEDHYLVSLFHQGKIIKINNKDGSFEVVADNLTRPHSIRQIGDKFYIADSKNGRILVYDNNFNEIDQILIDKGWIQDIREIPNDKSKLFVADADNCNLHLIDLKSKQIIDTFSFSKNWRISTVMPIDMAG